MENKEYKKKMQRVAIFVIAGVVAVGAVALWLTGGGTGTASPSENAAENAIEDMAGNPLITLHTNKGDITLELFTDQAPITAWNFLKLASEGFFDGTKFHRVIPGFMIQGGDPTSKGDDSSLYGRGDPGYNIQDEFVAGLSNVRGTIAMANIGQPNSGGSQFFINIGDNTALDYDKQPLTSRHPVFGQVTAGMEVADAISQTPTGERDIPLEPVIIERVSISQSE